MNPRSSRPFRRAATGALLLILALILTSCQRPGGVSDADATPGTPPAGSVGIGVTRGTLMAYFKANSFRISQGLPSDGRDNFVGEKGATASFQLIGPAENLNRASYTDVIPKRDEEMEYFIGFIKTALPTWTDGPALFKKAVANRAEDVDETVRVGNVLVRFSITRLIGLAPVHIKMER